MSLTLEQLRASLLFSGRGGKLIDASELDSVLERFKSKLSQTYVVDEKGYAKKHTTEDGTLLFENVWGGKLFDAGLFDLAAAEVQAESEAMQLLRLMIYTDWVSFSEQQRTAISRNLLFLAQPKLLEAAAVMRLGEIPNDAFAPLSLAEKEVINENVKRDDDWKKDVLALLTEREIEHSIHAGGITVYLNVVFTLQLAYNGLGVTATLSAPHYAEGWSKYEMWPLKKVASNLDELIRYATNRNYEKLALQIGKPPILYSSRAVAEDVRVAVDYQFPESIRNIKEQDGVFMLVSRPLPFSLVPPPNYGQWRDATLFFVSDKETNDTFKTVLAYADSRVILFVPVEEALKRADWAHAKSEDLTYVFLYMETYLSLVYQRDNYAKVMDTLGVKPTIRETPNDTNEDIAVEENQFRPAGVVSIEDYDSELSDLALLAFRVANAPTYDGLRDWRKNNKSAYDLLQALDKIRDRNWQLDFESKHQALARSYRNVFSEAGAVYHEMSKLGSGALHKIVGSPALELVNNFDKLRMPAESVITQAYIQESEPYKQIYDSVLEEKRHSSPFSDAIIEKRQDVYDRIKAEYNKGGFNVGGINNLLYAMTTRFDIKQDGFLLKKGKLSAKLIPGKDFQTWKIRLRHSIDLDIDFLIELPTNEETLAKIVVWFDVDNELDANYPEYRKTSVPNSVLSFCLMLFGSGFNEENANAALAQLKQFNEGLEGRFLHNNTHGYKELAFSLKGATAYLTETATHLLLQVVKDQGFKFIGLYEPRVDGTTVHEVFAQACSQLWAKTEQKNLGFSMAGFVEAKIDREAQAKMRKNPSVWATDTSNMRYMAKNGFDVESRDAFVKSIDAYFGGKGNYSLDKVLNDAVFMEKLERFANDTKRQLEKNPNAFDDITQKGDLGEYLADAVWLSACVADFYFEESPFLSHYYDAGDVTVLRPMAEMLPDNSEEYTRTNIHKLPFWAQYSLCENNIASGKIGYSNAALLSNLSKDYKRYIDDKFVSLFSAWGSPTSEGAIRQGLPQVSGVWFGALKDWISEQVSPLVGSYKAGELSDLIDEETEKRLAPIRATAKKPTQEHLANALFPNSEVTEAALKDFFMYSSLELPATNAYVMGGVKPEKRDGLVYEKDGNEVRMRRLSNDKAELSYVHKTGSTHIVELPKDASPREKLKNMLEIARFLGVEWTSPRVGESGSSLSVDSEAVDTWLRVLPDKRYQSSLGLFINGLNSFYEFTGKAMAGSGRDDLVGRTAYVVQIPYSKHLIVAYDEGASIYKKSETGMLERLVANVKFGKGSFSEAFATLLAASSAPLPNVELYTNSNDLTFDEALKQYKVYDDHVETLKHLGVFKTNPVFIQGLLKASRNCTDNGETFVINGLLSQMNGLTSPKPAQAIIKHGHNAVVTVDGNVIAKQATAHEDAFNTFLKAAALVGFAHRPSRHPVFGHKNAQKMSNLVRDYLRVTKRSLPRMLDMLRKLGLEVTFPISFFTTNENDVITVQYQSTAGLIEMYGIVDGTDNDLIFVLNKDDYEYATIQRLTIQDWLTQVLLILESQGEALLKKVDEIVDDTVADFLFGRTPSEPVSDVSNPTPSEPVPDVSNATPSEPEKPAGSSILDDQLDLNVAVPNGIAPSQERVFRHVMWVLNQSNVGNKIIARGLTLYFLTGVITPNVKPEILDALEQFYPPKSKLLDSLEGIKATFLQSIGN